MKQIPWKWFVHGSRTGVLCVLMLGAAGCALDLRCEPVTKRILRHEGAAWRMYEEKKNEGQHLDSLDLQLDKPSDEQHDEPTNFCERNGARRTGHRVRQKILAPAQAAVPAPTEATTPPQALQPEVCHSPSEALADPDREPGPEVTRYTEEARAKYIYGREFRLSDDSLVFSDETSPIPLFLVNKGLNCRPSEKDGGHLWRCNELDDEKLNPPVGSTLEKCISDISNSYFGVTNLVGVIEDRYCLRVSISEHKPEKKEFTSSPTNINRDRLLLKLYCAVEGPKGTKSIVGGPKPELIKPIKVLSGAGE